ncbi:MAG: hypothetical protein ABJD68_12375 [Nakamurella sp.]
MKDWSRRNMLRATAGAAIAVPMAALVSTPASAAVGGGSASGADSAPPPVTLEGPVMFCVHDAQRGEVSILHGTTEVIVTDRQLVARILSAAAVQA